MAGQAVDVEALSPRDANARRPRSTVADLKTKAAAQLKASKDAKKDQHPPPPPLQVKEPPSADRREGAVYQMGKLLGKGGFATCYTGTLAGTRKVFALKIVKSKMPTKMEQKFQTELQIHSKMHHANIVEFHRAFSFEQSTYLVLELCPNGSLMDMVKRRKGLTEPEVRFYAVQIAGAIKYMHAKGVIHRDLKMGNIFLDRHMNAKIGDFGLAALVVTGRDMQTIRRTTLCGTPNYIAPEILQKDKQGHDHMVDIWSLGIIMFAMLTSKPPFQSSTTDEIYRRARARDYAWPARAAESGAPPVSGEAQHVVASMLQDAALRPMPDDIVQHPFFVGGGFMPTTEDMAPRLRELPPDRQVFYEATPTPTPGSLRPLTTAGQRNFETMQALCAASGVGPWTPTKLVYKPVWREMAAEEKANLTPLIPLAEGIVYRSYETWVKENRLLGGVDASSMLATAESTTTTSLSAAAPGSGPSPSPSPPLAEWSRQTAATVASVMETSEAQRGMVAAAMPMGGGTLRSMPPQSFAAHQRAQNRPASVLGGVAGAAAGGGSGSRATGTTELVRRPSARNAARRDIPLANGLSLQAREEKAAAAAATSSTSTGTRSRTALPGSRSAAARSTATSTSERRTAGATVRGTVRGSRAVGGGVVTTTVSAPVQLGSTPAVTTMVSPPVGVCRSLFSPSERQESVVDSSPEAILGRLRKLQAELDRALNARTMAFVSPARDKVLGAAPQIVVKWVDYTNKFGLGYILNNGSIGCILRTIPLEGGGGGDNGKERTERTGKSEKGYLPPACLVVHGAERHILRREDPAYGDRHQIVPMGSNSSSRGDVGRRSIDFYENNGEVGLVRVRVDPARFRVAVDARTGAVGKLAAGQDVFDHRKRERIVLWKKFANYMLAYGREVGDEDEGSSSGDKTASSATDLPENAADGGVVTFYQRFGDVGCWVFGDGHLQFNFPDHTKLVLDAGGVWCHFWHLPADAATHLAATGQLDDTALDARSVLSYPLQTLLNFGVGAASTGAGTSSASASSATARRRPQISEALRGIPAANDLRRKVDFVRSVVREWVANGGLGNSDMSRASRLRWLGARETHKNGNVVPPSKHVWVTIGARQGDVRLAAMVDPRRPNELGADLEEKR